VRILQSIAAIALTLSAAPAFSADDAAVTRALDRQTAGDLLVTWEMARDSTDLPRLREILTADAQLTTPAGVALKNRDDIVRSVEGENGRLNPGLAEGKFGIVRHVIANLQVELHGDAAKISCYDLTIVYNKEAKRPEISEIGRTEADAVKVKGKWHLKAVRARLDNQTNQELL